MTSEEPRNRLAFEKSPYLLQHAENPVDWYPWGAEAFEKAKMENKPVFLSIGYSTCHWCHVMAHESFEDSTIARLMNDVFVSVKVDREERPDIDMVYMTVCQMLTGSGGWPLTIIMTPDKQPFFAGTYIPKETGFGRIGLIDLIPRVKELWATRQVEVISSASQTTAALQQTSLSVPGAELGEPMLHRAYEELSDRFDRQWGGFGTAPKFPTAHSLLFLLRYWKRTGNKKALTMVEKTLQMISRGGIFDHIGFGFHRYSTDQRWLVPHFEKMLYDQAMLAMAYIETYQATRNEEYARTAHEIFAYVLRDMTAADGGFYSAEDADSEGEEGKFYLWTYGEIKHILTPDEADLFIKVFNIGEDGNFTDEAVGRNIPHITRSLEEIASEFGVAVPELQKRLESIRQKLFGYREQRIHPHKDDKILTDWNGLMVAALAKGARVLNEPRYAIAAKRASGFIFDNMLDTEGRLFHRYRDGEAAIPAYLDDYAFLVHGMLELYETIFEPYYLVKAMELNQHLIEHFWDDKNGGFYFTSDDNEGILMRQKEIYDGAIPSGNSIAMLNLLRLGRITADSALEQKAAQIGRAFSERVQQSPSAYTQLMTAIDFAVGPSYEIAIVGDPAADDTRAMLRAIDIRFIPNTVLILLSPEPGYSDIKRIIPFIGQMSGIEGKATAYVCHNYSCKLPTTDIDTMLRLLDTNQ
ncbi:MAG: thioredoxin domain-containing protein, partial [Dehalococcoidales bacterium]|nr:thioredoxin domain-containing protein [Dehalococcoidales bacterium]